MADETHATQATPTVALSATLTDPLAARDPGPMARFEEFVAREGAMGEVAQRVMDGQTLKQIAKSLQMPYGRLAQWVTEDVKRAQQYAAATAIWADEEARRTVALADELGPDSTKGEVSAVRVQIGARQFLATKLDRERYGDKSTLDVKVEDKREPVERERLLLETARSLAFVLWRGDQARDNLQTIEQLPAPSETQATDPQRNEDPI